MLVNVGVVPRKIASENCAVNKSYVVLRSWIVHVPPKNISTYFGNVYVYPPTHCA